MRVRMLDRVCAFKRGAHLRTASSTWPSIQNTHAASANMATSASWPAAPGGQSVGLLACAEHLDGAFEFLSGLHVPMNMRIIARPRITLSNAPRLPRVSAALGMPSTASSACGSSRSRARTTPEDIRAAVAAARTARGHG